MLPRTATTRAPPARASTASSTRLASAVSCIADLACPGAGASGGFLHRAADRVGEPLAQSIGARDGDGEQRDLRERLTSRQRATKLDGRQRIDAVRRERGTERSARQTARVDFEQID